MDGCIESGRYSVAVTVEPLTFNTAFRRVLRRHARRFASEEGSWLSGVMAPSSLRRKAYCGMSPLLSTKVCTDSLIALTVRARATCLLSCSSLAFRASCGALNSLPRGESWGLSRAASSSPPFAIFELSALKIIF